MQPLSVSREAGTPCFSMALVNASATSVARATGTAIDATHNREWSSRKLMISTWVWSASDQCVMSDCQHSLGSDASKRTYDDRGRFFGSGVMHPRLRSTRVIVLTDGAAR